MCDSLKSVISNSGYDYVIGFAQAPCARCNHIQYRLNVGRRAGDDTEDFARRSLLLQRLFEFLEQPHVLDRYNSLVGERFKQLDLRWGEGSHLDPARSHSANELTLLT
jgi:hypothetical protein